MRIAYVCQSWHWDSYSYARCMYETLLAFGHEVRLFRNMDNIRWKPEQVWVASSLVPLNEVDAFTVVFGLSDPNMFAKERMEFGDLYCTISLDISKEYGAYHFPYAGNAKYFRPLRLERKVDCVFTGVGKHPWIPERPTMVRRLREAGLRVLAYGPDWRSIEKHPDNKRFARGRGLIRAINSAKISVDLTNKKSSFSTRVFQGSMCTTPVLTCDRPDVRQLFEAEQEILLYRNIDDMVEIARSYITDPETLRDIGERALLRCVHDHTIESRIAELLMHIGRLRSAT